MRALDEPVRTLMSAVMAPWWGEMRTAMKVQSAALLADVEARDARTKFLADVWPWAGRVGSYCSPSQIRRARGKGQHRRSPHGLTSAQTSAGDRLCGSGGEAASRRVSESPPRWATPDELAAASASTRWPYHVRIVPDPSIGWRAGAII
jgi:hypothetical protein